MEAGTPKFDAAMQGIETIHIEFYRIYLCEVYEVQQVAVSEIWLRENDVSYHEAKYQRKPKACKALLKDKEKENFAREHSKVSLVEIIKSAVAKFPLEASHEDEYSEGKVSRISCITRELKKQVETTG